MKRFSLIGLALALSLVSPACAAQETAPEISQSLTQSLSSPEASTPKDNPSSETITSSETAPSPNFSENNSSNIQESSVSPEPENVTEEQASVSDESKGELMNQKRIFRIDGNQLSVVWEDNIAVEELFTCAQEEGITVHTSIYGGFEQVGSLPYRFSQDDLQITTEPGDIVLYSGDQLVVFFGENTWSYTMLGHIQGLSQEELTSMLRKDTTVIEIEVEK